MAGRWQVLILLWVNHAFDVLRACHFGFSPIHNVRLIWQAPILLLTECFHFFFSNKLKIRGSAFTFPPPKYTESTIFMPDSVYYGGEGKCNSSVPKLCSNQVKKDAYIPKSLSGSCDLPWFELKKKAQNENFEIPTRKKNWKIKLK